MDLLISRELISTVLAPCETLHCVALHYVAFGVTLVSAIFVAAVGAEAEEDMGSTSREFNLYGMLAISLT